MLHNVPRETVERLELFSRLIVDEAARQNLISTSTLPHTWSRHIVDSAQLAPLAPTDGSWLDIGSGAGLPGIVIALLRPRMTMTLVEPRALRADFLRRCVAELGLAKQVDIKKSRLETLESFTARVISARAVASTGKLFAMAARFADCDTLWLLPKGRSAAAELEAAREAWQGSFELVPSITDPDARIVVARHVQPKGRR